MKFDFDENKNQINISKHGIGLNDACGLWLVSHITVPAKNISGESRYFIIGKIKSKIYVAVYTIRNESIRIISCHRADKKLERYYYEKIK